MKVFRVIIAGSRTFTNYELMREKLDKFLSGKQHITILSGDARGADTLAVRYARERKIPVEHFPAEWDIYGKSAGYIRNEWMAEEADALVAFWDGISPGTRHMIELAKAKGLPTRIINI